MPNWLTVPLDDGLDAKASALAGDSPRDAMVRVLLAREYDRQRWLDEDAPECPHCGEPALAVVMADTFRAEETAPDLSWCGDPNADVRLYLHRSD